MLDNYAVAGITVYGGDVEVSIAEDDLLRPTHVALLHATDTTTRFILDKLVSVGLNYEPLVGALSVLSFIARGVIGHLPIADRTGQWASTDVLARYYASCRLRDLLLVNPLVDPYDVTGRLRGSIHIESVTPDQSRARFHLTDETDNITGYLSVDLRREGSATLKLLGDDLECIRAKVVSTADGLDLLVDGLSLLGWRWAARNRARTPAVIVHQHFQTPPEVRDTLWFWLPLARAAAWTRDRLQASGAWRAVSPLVIPDAALRLVGWMFGRDLASDLALYDLDIRSAHYISKLRDLPDLPDDLLAALLTVKATPGNSLDVGVSLVGKAGGHHVGSILIQPGGDLQSAVSTTLCGMWASDTDEDPDDEDGE